MRLEGLLKKENLKEADLAGLRDKLMAIDAEWKQGKIAAPGGQVVRAFCLLVNGSLLVLELTSLCTDPPDKITKQKQPEGQAVISELLERAHALMAQVQNKL